MLTVRINKELEDKLQKQAEAENAAKSEIVKRAIREYIDRREKKKTAYELGKDFFGLEANAGAGELSKDNKSALTKYLKEKFKKPLKRRLLGQHFNEKTPPDLGVAKKK